MSLQGGGRACSKTGQGLHRDPGRWPECNELVLPGVKNAVSVDCALFRF